MSEAKSDVKKAGLKLSEEVLKLSAALEKAMIVSSENGSTAITGKPYDENLPETLTPELVEAVDNYNIAYVAAGTHAFGKLAVAAMAKNKKLETATVDLAMGSHNELSLTSKRAKAFKNNFSKEKEVITKYGQVTPMLTMVAGDTKSDQLKAARSEVSRLAQEALG